MIQAILYIIFAENYKSLWISKSIPIVKIFCIRRELSRFSDSFSPKSLVGALKNAVCS